ncbi:MAG: mechanosensitive ion channel [Bryobacteraceae bacterium]
MTELWQQVSAHVTPYLPRLAGALATLVIGWILALIVASVVRGVLRRTSLDNKLAAAIAGEEQMKGFDLERWISRGAFYIAMLFVLVAFFHALGLESVSAPMNVLLASLFAFAPRALAALLLAMAAWLVATVMRTAVRRVMGAAALGKFSAGAGIAESERTALSARAGDAVYWLVMLLFVPAILGTLDLDGILEPLQVMMASFLGFLPRLLGAAAVMLVGWFAARILRQVVSSLLAAAGIDQAAERAGVGNVLGGMPASAAAGGLAYILVLIPATVAALNALGLEAVTQPASNLLNSLLSAVPLLFGAALILIFAWVTARLVGGIVTNLLRGIGFDRVPAKLGITTAASASRGIGSLATVAVVLFGAAEAARFMGFRVVEEMSAGAIVFGSHILVGVAIFGIGLYLANLAAGAVSQSAGNEAALLATAVRIAVIVFAGAMALRQMGLANEIVSLAFGLILGAVAVAVAIAFGIGGREVAGRRLEHWVRTIEGEKGAAASRGAFHD